MAGTGTLFAALSGVSRSSAFTAVAGGIASFMVGGAGGFLFGIPRYATSDDARSGVPPQVIKYEANTNLEQISDWLTKIIVGIGLTQFRAIGDTVGDISFSLAQGLTDDDSPSPSAKAIAMSLLLLNTLCGFLYFYIWSRVYLPHLFGRAESTDLTIHPSDEPTDST